VERQLPAPTVKKRIADLCVGLASDCDNPEAAVDQIMRTRLQGATGLPFVAFITHDKKWVDGYSGHKTGSQFITILEKAENTPYLKASPATQKKIAGLLKKAEKAAPKNDWKAVMKSHQAARKMEGRCPERTALDSLADQGRAWAAKEFRAAIKLARDDKDTSAAHKKITNVKRLFAGEPEAAEATEGIAAAAAAYEGKRWAGLFGEGFGDDEKEDEGEESVIE
jgi:hypothetical protein